MENSRTYYYARVSSQGQNLARQIEAFKNMGADDREIITEKKSGADFDNREAYKALRNQMLRSGDTLVVMSLDRLGRNKALIKSELEYFKQNGIRVKVLDIPTTMVDFPDGQEWVLDMVNNILIEVLGAIAEQERHTIRKRQEQGIEAAHKKGVKFGRPAIEKPANFDEVVARWLNKEITAVKAMEETGLTRCTFYKLVKA